jgi:hypothetical protein
MLRRIWISICVLLSFVSAALALSPSEIAVLFNRGIKPAYYANLLTGTLPSSLTFARAGQATQYDATGNLTYAPNNLLTYSNTFTNAAWGASNGGTAVAPTLTASYAIDPNGQPATRFQASLGATPASAYSRIYQTGITTTNVTKVAIGFWAKTNDLSTVTMFSNSASAYGLFTVTPSWTFIPLIYNNSLSALSIGIAGASSPFALTTSTSVDVSIAEASVASIVYETAPRPQDQVITTSAAYYGPRFDYNPNTLAPLGLLIEGSATNLFTPSNMVTGWSTSGIAAIASNQSISPDGTNNALKLYATASTNDVLFYQIPTVTNATTYTQSVFVKPNNWRYFMVFANSGQSANFDLTAGTIGSLVGATAAIQALPNGWFRVSMTWATTATNAALGFSLIAASNSAYASTVTGDGSSGVYLYGAQLELGSFATSYIPTAASIVTRAADIVQFTGGALTTLQGSQGAVIVQMLSEGATNPAANTNILKGTNSILYRDTTGKLGTTNGTTALLTSGTPTWTSVNRVGLSWSPGNRLLNYTAATAANDNNSAANGGTIYLGSNNGSNAENGWYQSFGIYNQPLANSNFQPRLVVGAPY